MTAFPDISGWGNTTTGQTVIDQVQQFLAATKQLPGAEAFSELTISGGVVVPTGCAHTVDTEADASSDFLDKIQVTNMRSGSLLILRPQNVAHAVTMRHMQGGSGQLYLGSQGSYVLNQSNSAIVLQLVGTIWYELMRTVGATMSGENQEFFNSSGTFNVPTGITKVFVTGGGGGGGGGGGAGSADNPGNGSNGSNGGNTTITGGLSFTALGGGGGNGAIGVQGGEDKEQGGGPGQNSAGTSGGWGGGASPTPHGAYGQGGHGGRGGSGGGSNAGGGGGGGGACGQFLVRQEYSVTPGASCTVTVGAGGAGGNGGGNGSAGSAGATGIVLIEW